jgi:hypothetical protein
MGIRTDREKPKKSSVFRLQSGMMTDRPLIIRHTLRSIFTLLFAVGMMLSSFTPAAAQEAPGIIVTTPDTSAYPLVSTSFRAYDEEGDFMRNIRPGELRVSENGATLPDYELELAQTGVRFFVAVNEGPTLANRFSGVSRFDRIKTALFNWVAANPVDTTNAFSLVTNQGPLTFSSTDRADWQSALEAYQPDLKSMMPGMSSLSIAVDSALSVNLQDQKTSAVLFITPMPTESQFNGLQEIITRARSNGIHVFIWLIGPTDYAGLAQTLRLEQYAQDTGGRFFLFSGAEELPALRDWLEPLSYFYKLSYKTKANVSGEYQLVLKLTRGETSLESAPVIYSYLISPPNPIFLSPPAEIVRSWTDAKKKSDAVLTPNEVELEIMVEFPDGMPRDLAVSRFIVDGELEAEITSEPFTTFTWDISSYTESATHSVQVYIEDIAGLKGETIEIPVQVTVEDLSLGLMDRLLDLVNPVNIVVGVVLLAVVVGGLIVVIRAARRRIPGRKARQKPDPVTQPVSIEGTYTLSPEKPERVVRWPIIRGLGLAPARLLQKRSASPEGVEYLLEIPLGKEELVIGSESKKADYVLLHPSVSPRHARIFKDAEGGYRIADAGSASGTWVNYAPVSTRGVSLEHGDLVQFGRLAYIFEVHGATPKRVQVLPYKED